MSRRKSIVEKSTSLLLGLGAHIVARDQAFNAPTMDREEVAELLCDAVRFRLLEPSRLAADLEAFADCLKTTWAQRDQKAKADDGQIGTLSLGLMAMIAVDNVVTKEWLATASQSRHFGGRVAKHNQDDVATRREKLSCALKKDSVAQALLATGLLQKEEIFALVGDLEVRETRAFLQRHLRYLDVPPPSPPAKAARHGRRTRTSSLPEGDDHQLMGSLTDEPVVEPTHQHLTPEFRGVDMPNLDPPSSPAASDAADLGPGDEMEKLKARYSALVGRNR